MSSAGVVYAAYTWGADGLVSERLPAASPSAKSLWYQYGPQGETRALTSSTGAIADSYSYTAYGKAISASGGDANPFQFGGKFGYYSEYNGAVLCGHRWYDTHDTLRWLSRDPIGYEGGDNLYAYCGGDPIGGIDPDGLQARRGPGVKQGPGGTSYATDMNERPRPDMHIWHGQGETVITPSGGWRSGTHLGHDLVPLPKPLRRPYRYIIRKFCKQALRYLPDIPGPLEVFDLIPGVFYDGSLQRQGDWMRRHPGQKYYEGADGA